MNKTGRDACPPPGVCGPRDPLISGFTRRVPESMGSAPSVATGNPAGSADGTVFSREILDNPRHQPPLRRLDPGGRRPAQSQPPRILFAEDSQEQRLLIKHYMKTLPCTVEFAHDGAEAVARFQADPCSIVFMDMRMPKMDGLEATRAIRRWEAGSACGPARIIALTGLSGDSDYEKIREAGCDGILTKPYSKRGFLQKMKEVLKIP